MVKIKYCVFDVETTGLLEENRAEIIEFGCKFLDIDYNILKSYSTLIKPENIDLTKPLPDWSIPAFKINKINPEELKKAPKVEVVVPTIIGMFTEAGKPIIAGHNIYNFDIPMMERLFNICGNRFSDFIGRPILDTYILSYFLLGNKVTNFKQGTVAKALGIKVKGSSHRVDYDTEENALLLKELSKFEINKKDNTPKQNSPEKKVSGGKKYKCPACGTGYFILRENKKKGSQFYGCSNFPKCRMTCEIYNIKKYPVAV